MSDYNGQWNRDPGWQEQRVKWRPLLIFGAVAVCAVAAVLWWLG